MSLHIDFIYENERRSASLITFKFVLGLSGIVIPLVALAFATFAVLRYHQLKSELDGVEFYWNTLEPEYLEAQQIRAELEAVRAIDAEFERWRNARMGWAKPLEAVREVVPPSIQLTRLQIRDDLKIDRNVPVYHFDIMMEGRARGASPRTDVEQLQDNLRKHSAMVEIVDQVIIPPGSFQADPDRDAEREHRIFRLHAPLIPRRFE